MLSVYSAIVPRPRKAKPGDPKKAVAYIRVSTDKQEHGPAAQRRALEAWTKANGVEIVETLEEKESGAAEIADRPELQAALAAVSKHRAGILLAAKRDRLARDVRIAGEIGEETRFRGAVLVTADGMSDTDGSSEGLIKQGFSDLFAAIERKRISERTVTALGGMKARGLRTGGVPYGFEATPDKRLRPNTHEQTVCALVMRLHGEGQSERQIERALSAKGVKSRRGHSLAQMQVHRIIKGAEARAALLALWKEPP